MSRRSARHRRKRRIPPVTYATPDVAPSQPAGNTVIPCPACSSETPRHQPLFQVILSAMAAAFSGAANALVTWLLRR